MGGKCIKLNEMGKQKLERLIRWQWAKHAKIIFYAEFLAVSEACKPSFCTEFLTGFFIQNMQGFILHIILGSERNMQYFILHKILGSG